MNKYTFFFTGEGGDLGLESRGLGVCACRLLRDPLSTLIPLSRTLGEISLKSQGKTIFFPNLVFYRYGYWIYRRINFFAGYMSSVFWPDTG